VVRTEPCGPAADREHNPNPAAFAIPAMVTMSNNLDVKAKMEGSVGGALLRCCCTSESFFTTHFS
jgi:uncharacterized protein (AIM24 family)